MPMAELRGDEREKMIADLYRLPYEMIRCTANARTNVCKNGDVVILWFVKMILCILKSLRSSLLCRGSILRYVGPMSTI